MRRFGVRGVTNFTLSKRYVSRWLGVLPDGDEASGSTRGECMVAALAQRGIK